MTSKQFSSVILKRGIERCDRVGTSFREAFYVGAVTVRLQRAIGAIVLDDCDVLSTLVEKTNSTDLQNARFGITLPRAVFHLESADECAGLRSHGRWSEFTLIHLCAMYGRQVCAKILVDEGAQLECAASRKVGNVVKDDVLPCDIAEAFSKANFPVRNLTTAVRPKSLKNQLVTVPSDGNLCVERYDEYQKTLLVLRGLEERPATVTTDMIEDWITGEISVDPRPNIPDDMDPDTAEFNLDTQQWEGRTLPQDEEVDVAASDPIDDEPAAASWPIVGAIGSLLSSTESKQEVRCPEPSQEEIDAKITAVEAIVPDGKEPKPASVEPPPVYVLPKEVDEHIVRLKIELRVAGETMAAMTELLEKLSTKVA